MENICCWCPIIHGPQNLTFNFSLRVHTSLGAPPAWRWQEAQEEELHYPEEDQTQAQEGQAGSPQILPRGRQRQDPPSPQVSTIKYPVKIVYIPSPVVVQVFYLGKCPI